MTEVDPLISGSHIVQCSEPSSPSVLGVGPDGPLVVVRLFLSPRTDYGIWRTGRPRGPVGPCRALLFRFPETLSS